MEVEILKGMDGGIPSALMNPMSLALQELDVFETTRDLRTFFERDTLKPWKNSLPEAGNLESRVSLTIAFTNGVKRATNNNGTWFDGQRLLMIMIIELYAYYYSKAAVTDGLDRLMLVLTEQGYLKVSKK